MKFIPICIVLLFIGLAFAPSINANMGKRKLKYSEPDICCEGELYWLDAKPGETATGHFEVSNCGEEGSLLGCEIIDWPDWGTWKIDPMSWNNQAPEDGPVTVDVEVIAPDEIIDDLYGHIKVINKDEYNNYCEIGVLWRRKSAKINTEKSSNEGWMIDIEITKLKGIGVHAVISNGWDNNLEDVRWSITLDKDFGEPIIFGRERKGTIDIIPVDGEVNIWSFTFGLATPEIFISVDTDIGASDSISALGKIIGPFVIIYHIK